jgi:hypothetical protein
MQQITGITPELRTLVLNVISNLAEYFNVRSPVVVYMSMSNLDRYLSMRELPKSDLVLMVIVSFLVASKLEENVHATLLDLEKATYSFVCKEEIFLKEAQFVQGLDYRLWIPTAKVCKRKGIICKRFLSAALRKSRAGEKAKKMSLGHAYQSTGHT